MVSNIYIRFIFIPVRVFTDFDFNKNKCHRYPRPQANA